MGQFGEYTTFHFIGLGGIGMSGIAEILLRQGYAVSGSDLSDGPILDQLRLLGARVEIGHGVENLGPAEVVIYSSAVKPENPEMLEARRRGLPVVPRGEMLAALMRTRTGISVAGTHGKTTTTSMAGLVLVEAGYDPTVIVGARVTSLGGSNARAGAGDYLVAESDESDRSFLNLSPVYVIVTNVDLDHMDQYRDLEDVSQAFAAHIDSIPFYGCAVLCRDDANLRQVMKKIHRPMITYGLQPGADLVAREVEPDAFAARYQCEFRGESLGEVQLRVGGVHNVLNSLAAVAIGLRLQVPFSVIRSALEKFTGAERRMQRKGERNGVLVIDDYGHHPVEIRATLSACKQMSRRIVLVFQPHRYTRTAHLLEEFAACFQQADKLYLMDIYAAGEDPIPGISSAVLARHIAGKREVHYVSATGQLLERLRQETRSGDLLLTMGAGNVWKIGEAFLEYHAC